MEPTQKEIDRFWEKVDTKSVDECWNWIAHLNEDGYGQFRYDGNMKIASRVAYIFVFGEIKGSQKVMHKCDNRSCCNPNHLFLGTQRDNILDMESKGRGRHNGKTVRLFEDQIIQVREMWNDGIQAKEISNIFGVTPATVYKIRMGITYKNVGGPIDTYTKRGRRSDEK